jgi:hypothetical protein
LRTVYDDAQTARISLELAEKVTPPPSLELWVDPGVDGFDDITKRRSGPDKRNSWYEFMKDIPCFTKIAESSFLERPDAKTANEFVKGLLDLCVNKHKPAWITVPQLPIVDDSSRNRINRALAQATGEWKSSRRSKVRLILPLVFTHQNQINGKTQRNPKVAQAGRCYDEAQADGFWAVDASLTDESGSRTLRNTRFPAIIALHQELNERISSKIRIAGPYWGLNLVLWARGLVDYPAIGIGGSYQYYLPGGHFEQASSRVAISPLRRRVGVAQLGSWLVKSPGTLGSSHPAYDDLNRINEQLDLLNAQDTARKQVARSYKVWLDRIESTPPAGRSLALFQDLSAAYALGRSLDSFASSEGTARRPESVVEPLMLNCL